VRKEAKKFCLYSEGIYFGERVTMNPNIKEHLTFFIDHSNVLHIINRWKKSMASVKISPKYQIVIPKKIRESLQLKPGQKIQVILYGNRIELIPERKISDMRGFLKGINTKIDRDGDRI